MPISLVQRVSKRGTIRVWIGVRPRTKVPALTWTMDGQPVQAKAVRAIESARTPAQLGVHPARTFTGTYEFALAAPDVPHTIEVQADGERDSIVVRALPAAVPAINMGAQKLRILLVSCFDTATDRMGAQVGRYAAQFLQTQRPDLTLFLGDQVYLDLPIFSPPDPDEASIATDLENKYAANWFAHSKQPFGRGYAEVLSAAPSAFAPDDHEYWNNYPHVQPQLKNTFAEEARNNWTRAAVRMWSMFQKEEGTDPGDAVMIDEIEPLSILIADTRTDRRNKRLYTPRAKNLITTWAQNLAASQTGVGLLVTGQSLFEHEHGFWGKKADENLPDYQSDYTHLVAAVKLATSKRPVLCVTGDVHWGRVLAEAGATNVGRLFEVIASPSSLVNDPLQNVTHKFKFGKQPPWPKHSDAPEGPLHFQSFGPREFTSIHRQRGNHIVLLSLVRVGTGIQVEAQFQPMHPSTAMPVQKVTFTLR
jgi:hypothetical protein